MSKLPTVSEPATKAPSPSRIVGRVATAFVACLLTVAGFVAGKTLGQGAADSESKLVATPDKAEKPALTVDVVSLQRADSYAMSRQYAGRVESARQSDLAFERAGLVSQVTVEEGVHVAANAEIARLDTELLVAERDVRTARLNAEQARLNELVAGPRDEVLTAARAEIRQLQADLRLARLTEERQQRLFAAGSAPEQRFDEARLAAESLAARLAAASARLDELDNGTRPEQIDAQRAAVARAKAEVAAIQVDLEKSVLRAPFAGHIATRLVDEGEVVNAGQPVVHVIESSALEIRVGIPGSVANDMAIGSVLPTTVAGVTIDAEVARLSPQRSGETRTVDAILVPQPGASTSQIRDGDMAKITIETSVGADGFWLPITSLVEGVRGLWSCYRIEPGATEPSMRVAKRVQLEVIHMTQDRAFVNGPIRAGDSIVSSGTHRIVPGRNVTVATKASRSDDGVTQAR